MSNERITTPERERPARHRRTGPIHASEPLALRQVLANISLLGALWCTLVAGAFAEAKQPNIIFILADDLGYGDLGCYGQEFIETPNLDRLASEGLRFTQAYSGGTVCAASRGVLMTGLHGGHAPARDNVPHYATYLTDEHVTIADVLKGAGYKCGGIGKWSLGDPDTAGEPLKQGFESWLGYYNQDHAHYYYPNYLDDGEGRMEFPGNMETHEHYSHHPMAERTLQFIEESKDEPFFFYAAFTLPHFSAKSEAPDMLAIPSDEPYSDKPWSQKEKNYAAMVTMLDKDVGRIVDLVDKLGLSESTLILFSSDNGPWGAAPKKFNSAGPFRGKKRDLYEGGVRVPFIARWPGMIPENQVSEEVIAFWDLLPTFADLAGTDSPPGLDGISITAALKGGSTSESRDYLYFDYGHCRNRYDQAVRLGKWKGIRLGQGTPLQLYNLEDDPGETQDLAAQHPEVADRLAQIMERAMTPSDRYPIGEIYKGQSLWTPDYSSPTNQNLK